MSAYEELPAAVREAVESVFDGWYASATRIDWHDFIDRVEAQSDVDMGSSMASPTIRLIKAHVRQMRREQR